MAKKTSTYKALVGFDVAEGRFEAGDFVTGVKASTIEQLLADGDIEAAEQEVTDGDSEN